MKKSSGLMGARASRSLRRALAGATALAAVMTAPVFMQAAAQETQTGLDIVVVTANQREENIQDVAISVASVGEDKLANIFQAGEDVLALATRVPGVYGESSNGRVAPRFYIRGLGNTDFDLAASQPVSIIMDDVVMENVVLKSTPVFDLDNVQVYRGPQGTLFGRNTTAGIIRFTSARPTDTFEAKGSASWGTYNSVTAEGAVSGPINDMIKARAAVLYQHRDEWIDNTFNGPGDDIGEYDELAGRVLVQFDPTDRLSALVNLHARKLEGTAAVFRANILSPGSNKLNSSYDRDSVRFNQGGGNPQEYEGWGASANIAYDFGPAELTWISAYETTNGFSRGDIDGGVAGSGPGFIPFDSDTQDSIRDLDQTTNEIRLSDTTGGKLFWQAGLYYFDATFTVNTVGPLGFPPSTTLKHSNSAWAVYGQATYDITDAFSVTGGARYTEDDKDLVVEGNPALYTQVSDDHVSWELSAMYDISDSFSVYGRVADGFRGPSIQGRDVAFFAPPSVAQSETIMSYEAGWKLQALDNRLRLNGALYTYEVEDIQLTAVGGAGNTVQLLNADKGKAWGLEVDAEWAPMDNLVFTAGFSYVDTELDDPGLAVGICAQCTVTDPTVTLGGATRALIDGNPFPNAPETIADFTARYSIPLGADGELFVFTDWAWQGETNIFLYESREFNTDGQFEGGLRIGYARTDGKWEASLFARNITDEDNIKGGIDFNNNTAFVNDPRIIGVAFKFNH